MSLGWNEKIYSWMLKIKKGTKVSCVICHKEINTNSTFYYCASQELRQGDNTICPDCAFKGGTCQFNLIDRTHEDYCIKQVVWE